METRSDSEPSRDHDPRRIGRVRSPYEERLRRLGRRIKRVDLRGAIVAHPFAAIGIGAGIGAVIGLVRPMPERGRVTKAVVGAATTIAFRLARAALMRQLAQIAKEYIGHRRDDGRGDEPRDVSPPF